MSAFCSVLAHCKYVADKDGEKIEVPVDISKFESRETASITFPTYSLSPGFYKIYPKAERKNVVSTYF
jgi:hypothetical protein